MELTEDIKKYVLKKVAYIGKLLVKVEEKGGEATVNFEVSKSTKHHKTGPVFHADCTIEFDGQRFYASSDTEDIKQSIDRVKESLFREISQTKQRKQTLKTRGARSVKKMMKGLSKRNPETAKY